MVKNSPQLYVCFAIKLNFNRLFIAEQVLQSVKFFNLSPFLFRMPLAQTTLKIEIFQAHTMYLQ